MAQRSWVISSCYVRYPACKPVGERLSGEYPCAVGWSSLSSSSNLSVSSVFIVSSVCTLALRRLVVSRISEMVVETARHLSHFQDWMELHRAVASSSVSWRQSRWYHHLQVPSQCMPRSDISLPHSAQGLDVDWVSESSLFASSVFSGWLAWRDEATDRVSGRFDGICTRDDAYLMVRAPYLS